MASPRKRSLGRTIPPKTCLELEQLAKKHAVQYHRIVTFRGGSSPVTDKISDEETLAYIEEAYFLRKKYQPGWDDVGQQGNEVLEHQLPSFDDFLDDLGTLQRMVANGPVHSYCHSRLQLLEDKFRLHKIANAELERQANRFDNRDFYDITKVDCNRQLASGMGAHTLQAFIKQKLRTSPDEEIAPGKTLQHLFDEMGITLETLTLDKLDIQAEEGRDDRGNTTFMEDRVQLPTELSELHCIFLSHDNHINGKYLAELTRAMLDKVKKSNVALELRVPVCGLKGDEFSRVAEWTVRNDLLSENVMWAVQIPNTWSRAKLGATFSPAPDNLRSRRASVGAGLELHKGRPVSPIRPRGSVTGSERGQECPELRTFQDFLDNIFLPVREVSADESKDPVLARFLRRVGSFAIVGDEQTTHALEPTLSPHEWTTSDDPPYFYQMYYIFKEITQVNNIRRKAGLNTFRLVPAAGEGDCDLPLMAAYLLGASISNPVRLPKMPPLEYLFYLSQLGVHLNIIGTSRTSFAKNPIITYFRRGLNVCVCTSEPLRTHTHGEGLLEEYSLFQKLFQMSVTDISEMSRWSVLQSSFPPEQKRGWLGEKYDLLGVEGNDPDLTNVPDMRIDFRSQSYRTELSKVIGDDIEVKVCEDITTDDVCEPQPFTRIRLTNMHVLLDLPEKREAAEIIKTALSLRLKYIPRPSLEQQIILEENAINALQADAENRQGHLDEYECLDGVYTIVDPSGAPRIDYIPFWQFAEDYNWLTKACNRSSVISFSDYRIKTLLQCFNIYQSMNGIEESKTTGDFYSCTKVDNHIHMAAGMSSKELLGFIYDKVRNHGDDIVSFKDGKTLTLDEVYRSLGVDINSLTVDDLDVMADSDQLFHRFDRFNEKYNPLGSPALRECFLKTDNFMAGRYFAELCTHVLDRVAEDEVYFTELRLSIYGRKRDEWDKLARWALDNKVGCYCNKWLIQVPRIYHIFRRSNMVSTFGEVLDNIFSPLWEVSINPRSNWKLHTFLKSVTGFDSVDNEKVPDTPINEHTPTPDEWEAERNPPYAYWLYYMYANLRTLNQYRRSVGLSVFTLRPHCGESGSVDHLAAAFLTSEGINHGVNLRKSPSLTYLYYLTQIPVSCSPLSNNALFLPLQKNPFPHLFKMGLNMTLSTDDPLQFHLTQEALVEEYSVASKLWKLSMTDLVEIARNSVLMSGFPYNVKAKALGPLYILSSSNGNQRYRSRLSDLRVAYRYETLDQENRLLHTLCNSPVAQFYSDKKSEEDIIKKYALSGCLSSELQRWLKLPLENTAPVAGRIGSPPLQHRPAGLGRVSFFNRDPEKRSPTAVAASRTLTPPLSAFRMPSATKRQSSNLASVDSDFQNGSRNDGFSPLCAPSDTTISVVFQLVETGQVLTKQSVSLPPDVGQRWDTLVAFVDQALEEMTHVNATRFHIFTKGRTLLRAWDSCIENDRQVIVQISTQPSSHFKSSLRS